MWSVPRGTWSPALSLWTGWVLVTTVGGAAAGVAVSALHEAIVLTMRNGAGGILASLQLGALGGAIVGAAQWLVLRGRLERAHRWVWASAWGGVAAWLAGLACVLVIGLALPSSAVRSTLAGACAGAAAGAVAGLAQSSVLASRVPRTAPWVTAIAAGGGVGGGVVGTLLGEILRGTVGAIPVGLGGYLGAWTLLWAIGAALNGV